MSVELISVLVAVLAIGATLGGLILTSSRYAAKLLGLLIISLFLGIPATAETEKTDSEVKQELIRRSISSYSGSCPCPYNRDRAGRRCGKRSAYSRPGGASPLCYERDVSQKMVDEYRARQKKREKGIPGLVSSETWLGIVIAPEQRCSPYSSGDYSYPQSVEQEIVGQIGQIYGPYTGMCFTSTRETDIEHIVARSEAHDSGLCASDAETRQRFARDLLNLTLASPQVNRRSKSDKDAAEWMPELNECWFASRIVQVRRKYGLTIDRREADTLEGVLSACKSTEIIVQSCGQ